MKSKKTITEVLLDSQLFGSDAPMPIGRNGRGLLGRYIGSVEILLETYMTEDGPDYISDYYLAYQLVTGEIIAVDGEPGKTKLTAKTLKEKQYVLHEGIYPIGFNAKWQCLRPATAANAKPVEVDELPF